MRFDRWFLLGIAFLLVFVPAAIRYDVGTDYMSYLAIYQDSWRLESYKKEPGFYFINWFYQSINAHFQWMFATFAFIFTAVAFKAYPKKNAWLLHFLFFSMLWFFSLTGIRQAASLAFCLLALFKFFEKQYFWFAITVVVASTFHQSAIVIGILGGLAMIPLPDNFKKRTAPLIFIVVIAISYFVLGVMAVYIEKILVLIGLHKYASYFGGKFYIARTDGTGVMALTKVLISVYILTRTKALLEINDRYWILAILVFLYAISVVFAMNIVIFGRMAITFVFVMPIAIMLVFSLKVSKLNTLIILFLMAFYLIAFTKDGFGIENSVHNPKLNPYQTIFEKR